MGVLKRVAMSVAMTSLIWSMLYVLGRSWGSTRNERERLMPGDELMENPRFVSNHAATVVGGSEEVWPWIVQMGWHRGGFYTYRWVDRLLFPANAPSADRILFQYQNLRVGDRIPDGPPETHCFFQVEILEPNQLLVLRSWTHLPPQLRDDPCVRMEWTWTFHLNQLNESETRLHFRVRGELEPWWLLLIYRLFIVPADFVMGRSLCLGLKNRVEGSSEPSLSFRNGLVAN